MNEETVSIPRPIAEKIASELRATAEMFVTGEPGHSSLLQHAALLDPPSLRKDVAELLRNTSSGDRWDMADDFLALVRKHVERAGFNEPMPSLDGLGQQSCYALGYRNSRKDAMRLLGGGK